MRHDDFDIFTPQIKHKLSKGSLLISEPFLNEPFFTRSIILLAEYSAGGAMGFVINKPSKLYPDEMLENLNNFRDPLYYGGPISFDNLYFVHTLGDTIPHSNHICDNLWWGGDYNILWNMLNSGEADYRQVRFFTGYSGWQPGQLEHEVRKKSWIVSPTDSNAVFAEESADLWGQLLRKMGDVYKIWANFPRLPQLN